MNADGGALRVVRFPWQETGEQLDAFAARWPDALADRQGRAFTAAGGVLRLPLVLPPARPGEPAAQYRARLPERLGRQCVLLLQAGAMAIGWWDEDELLRHKASRRYVVRGQGRAQPLHLRVKGKSRQGARLRLQNWRRLLQETNARLHAWWDELGAPEHVLYSVPVRALAELFAAAPPPPFARDQSGLRRLPLHVHRPDFDELLRVRRLAARGRLELRP